MKNFLTSKTFWFNVIIFGLTIMSLPEFISILPATMLPYIALLGATGNTALRLFFTYQPTNLNLLP